MAMKTVNPTDAYDKQKFVDAMKDFGKLENLLQGVSDSKGNWDPDIRSDIHSLINPLANSYAGLAPDSVIDDTRKAYSEKQNNLIGYAEKNFYSLLSRIKDENLLSLVLSLPLKDVGSSKVKKAVKAISEKRKVAKAAEEGDIQSFVAEKLAKASDWRKQAYFGYSIGNPDYTQRTFQAYAQNAEIDFKKAISDASGNLDSRILSDILIENYKDIDTSTDDGKKLAKAFQLTVAQAAYRSVK